MSSRPRRLLHPRQSSHCRFRAQKPQRRVSGAAAELGAPPRLIAPQHTLVLPRLNGVRDRILGSCGLDTVLDQVKAMVRKERLHRRHIEGCGSITQVLERALTEIVEKATPEPWGDRFGIEITLADCLDTAYRGLYRASEHNHRDRLFFIWTNTTEPQYIPLRPVFDLLQGNPYRERIMATLYRWLYDASMSVFHGFGLSEAQSFYEMRREFYLESIEQGEDADIEGEVEFANPSKVVPYIRESQETMLRTEEVSVALSSIENELLRVQVQRAHDLFILARTCKLPCMSRVCELILEEESYLWEESPIPALCISHWRDDPIVAWLDESVNETFQSGVACRPALLHCFPADDHEQFLQILAGLPSMVRIACGLSEWVCFAEEMERACDDRRRG